MPRPPVPREPRGAPALKPIPGLGFLSRIRFGKGLRDRFIIKILDRNAAERRDRELRELARLLTKSGHAEQVPLILGKAAEADDAKLKDIKRWTDRFCRGEAEVDRAPSNTTFKKMADKWTTGELHKKWPDHIRDIEHATNTVLLDKYVLPILG